MVKKGTGERKTPPKKLQDSGVRRGSRKKKDSGDGAPVQIIPFDQWPGPSKLA